MTGPDMYSQPSYEPASPEQLEAVVGDAGNTFDRAYIEASEHAHTDYITYSLNEIQLEGTLLGSRGVTSAHADYSYTGQDYPVPALNVSTLRRHNDGSLENRVVQITEEIPSEAYPNGRIVAKVDSLPISPGLTPLTLDEILARGPGSVTVRETLYNHVIAAMARNWFDLVSADSKMLDESNYPDASRTDVEEVHAVLHTLRETYPELRTPYQLAEEE